MKSLLYILVFTLLANVAYTDSKIDFNTQIRPILSNNCFNCHGPDAKARKGGSKKTGHLRLDNGEGAFNGEFIVPGKPEKSLLIEVVSLDADDDDIMPPSDRGEKLSKKDISLLKEWIRQGAQYDKHWSYAKIKKIVPPKVKKSSWIKNDIDHFILARLHKENLKPTEEADRYTMIRRLSLDLTGLPPTLAEAENFVKDKNSGAYENLVDRLLKKPAFGERWASVWLDLARYADSQGYTGDNFRNIWAYRDWVIKAINNNMPFDQFSIEQIAGDMLASPSQSQLIATAFNRNTLTNTEGGTIDEEFRVLAVKDRVNTVMQVWMGTTATCSQCHDHRYDPISQQDFYKLYSIFNNTADSDRGNDSPRMDVLDLEKQKQLHILEKEMVALQPTLTSGEKDWIVNFKAPSVKKSVALFESKLISKKNSSVNVKVSLQGSRKLFLVVGDAGDGISNDWANWLNPIVTGPKGKLDLTKHKWKKATAGHGKVRVNKSAGNKPISLQGKKRLGIGTHAKSVIEFDIPKGYTDFQATAALDDNSTSGSMVFKVFNKDPAMTPLQEVAAILKLPVAKRNSQQKQRVTNYYRQHVSPEYKTLNARIQNKKKEVRLTSVPIMEEIKSRVTNLHVRGSYLALGKEIKPGVPEEIFPFIDKYPKNRLGLAKWLMDENNPMTSRVVANRYWEKLFGIGIVSTSEEFGSQGELPSHPKLLDWMANYLRHNQWDTKKLIKLIVTSATYRQSSKVTGSVERDPNNRLLARGPRVRLTAEMVRDQGLFVSGLLSTKMYGPPVRPEQPKSGLTAAFGSSTDWKTSEGEDRYRRALYTTWRRVMPYPSMAAFDSPSRETCNVRRITTNTPLQALVTLNDPVYWEFSQAFAKRMIDAKKSQEDRLSYGFRLCLTRPAKLEEMNTLKNQFKLIESYLVKNPQKAKEIGNSYKSADLSEIEFATWVLIANSLINLDETIMKR